MITYKVKGLKKWFFMEKKAFVCIKTYGCSNNIAESQMMAGLLARAGYEIVKRSENADIIIFNTCSVKATTMNKTLFEIEETKKKFPEKRIIVAGCLPEVEYEKIKEVGCAGILSTGHLKKIVSVVDDVIDGNFPEITGKSNEVKLCLPRIRENDTICIVPICSGCNSFCSFCATKIAKGSIFSYPKETVMREIESAKKFGAKEFWITGQDISAYGLDENDRSMLPDLIEQITEAVGGKYFIRVGMMNPKNVVTSSNEMVRAFRSERVFKFLHLPIQSGSDRVLEKMGRGYKTEDFLEIVSKFRRHFPDITLWTDIIAGFPGENDEDFDMSLSTIRETKPDFVNVSQFSCHRKTAASKLKQVPSEIKKERTRILSKIAREISLEKNMKWIGWNGEILIDEYRGDRNSWIGRNYAYKPVVLRGDCRLRLGEFVKVSVKDARATCLIGELA